MVDARGTDVAVGAYRRRSHVPVRSSVLFARVDAPAGTQAVSAAAVHARIPTASAVDTMAITSDMILPTLAKGPIIRRPRVVGVAERFDLVGRAVRRMQQLHEAYGDGPLLLRLPVFHQAVVLAPQHVHRVLAESPEPFSADSDLKHASLSHFQPQAVLISKGAARADRRRFNEAVLDMPRPMHRLAERFRTVIEEEADVMLAQASRQGSLDWAVFSGAWFRVVRRVVLGDAARDDVEFTRLHERLRAHANLAFLQPKRRALRARFFARLRSYLERAEEGSLAAVMAGTHATDTTAVDHQPPHWLFAADPAGMATFRSLALLAAHPEHHLHARDEVGRQDEAPTLPFLRQCVLESLRLWPTTPLILRQTSVETRWETGVMPAGTSVIVFAPYFHRDDRHLAEAHRFAPQLWSRPRTSADWPLVPFSDGPVVCPGKNLVLLLTSTMLAELLRHGWYRERPPAKLHATRPMPSTLDNYTLVFELAD
jgi:cytochrome P450